MAVLIRVSCSLRGVYPHNDPTSRGTLAIPVVLLLNHSTGAICLGQKMKSRAEQGAEHKSLKFLAGTPSQWPVIFVKTSGGALGGGCKTFTCLSMQRSASHTSVGESAAAGQKGSHCITAQWNSAEPSGREPGARHGISRRAVGSQGSSWQAASCSTWSQAQSSHCLQHTSNTLVPVITQRQRYLWEICSACGNVQLARDNY